MYSKAIRFQKWSLIAFFAFAYCILPSERLRLKDGCHSIEHPVRLLLK